MPYHEGSLPFSVDASCPRTHFVAVVAGEQDKSVFFYSKISKRV